jgi:hypothetical protein
MQNYLKGERQVPPLSRTLGHSSILPSIPPHPSVPCHPFPSVRQSSSVVVSLASGHRCHPSIAAFTAAAPLFHSTPLQPFPLLSQLRSSRSPPLARSPPLPCPAASPGPRLFPLSPPLSLPSSATATANSVGGSRHAWVFSR